VKGANDTGHYFLASRDPASAAAGGLRRDAVPVCSVFSCRFGACRGAGLLRAVQSGAEVLFLTANDGDGTKYGSALKCLELGEQELVDPWARANSGQQRSHLSRRPHPMDQPQASDNDQRPQNQRYEDARDISRHNDHAIKRNTALPSSPPPAAYSADHGCASYTDAVPRARWSYASLLQWRPGVKP
jgi:hypothetical protein